MTNTPQCPKCGFKEGHNIDCPARPARDATSNAAGLPLGPTPITDAAEKRCELAVKMFNAMPKHLHAKHLAELIADIAHELLSECRNLERAACVQSAIPSMPAMAKTHPDTERLDWLEGMDVEVRTPLVHGSHHLFFAVPEQGDGDETPSKIRKQIDYERKGGDKP